jgi:K+-transporting ATPase KdpF subunit
MLLGLLDGKDLAGLIIGVVLIIYLLFALIYPEKL